MRLLKINEITIPASRQRQEFDPEALSALGEDIFRNGLYNAIKIEDTASGPELLQGERRLRAIGTLYEFGLQFKYDGKLVPLDLIPTTSDGVLTKLERRERELHENLQREALTWQEEQVALAELHQLRQEQAEASGSKQTMTATANEVRGLVERAANVSTGVAEVRRALTIAAHITDPDVLKASSPAEAEKVIRRKVTEQHNTKLAELMGKVASTARHTLLQGNCNEVMQNLDAQQFDVILTDPPYGVGAQEFGDQSDLTHKYDDSPATWRPLLQASVLQWTRLAKPQSHAYIFCDIRRWPELCAMFAAQQWDVWPVPLIWSKTNGILPRPEHGPRRTYESILYAIRGDRKAVIVKPDLIALPADAKKIHAAQKPVALYCDLLARTVKPGDRVLDAYCGSGTIFPAANRTHLYATGIEEHPAMYAAAFQRTEER